jgi:hypothetical protein
MSPISQLKELHKIKGSREKVADALGVDKSQVKRWDLIPGAGATMRQHSREKIAGVHEECRPFPLRDEFLSSARSLYVDLKAKPGLPPLRKYLITLDGFLKVDPADEVQLVQYLYMRTVVSGSKALHHGGNANWFTNEDLPRSKHLQDSQAHSERGMEVADEILRKHPEYEDIRHLRGLLFINWSQTILEQAKANWPDRNGRKRSLVGLNDDFRQNDVINTHKRILADFPYLWQAAYNGLEHSCVVRQDDDALFFHSELKRLDAGWQDFDYSPGEVLAISAEKGMSYFHNKYRDKLHIPNPTQQSKEKKK